MLLPDSSTKFVLDTVKVADVVQVKMLRSYIRSKVSLNDVVIDDGLADIVRHVV